MCLQSELLGPLTSAALKRSLPINYVGGAVGSVCSALMTKQVAGQVAKQVTGRLWPNYSTSQSKDYLAIGKSTLLGLLTTDVESKFSEPMEIYLPNDYQQAHQRRKGCSKMVQPLTALSPYHAPMILSWQKLLVLFPI